MSENRSREDLLRFLDYLGEKGLVARATAAARRTASAKVLAVLSEDEARDVLSLDLNQLMVRFDNLNRQQYTPDSLQTYKSRLKSALEDFSAYSENPISFRPSGKMRAGSVGKDAPKIGKKPSADEQFRTVTISPATSPAVDLPNVNQLPIPLRQNLTVRIFGLPFDLTQSEAQKIANIVLAHAMPSE